MKKIYPLFIVFFFFSSLLWNGGTVFGQCKPSILVDGNIVIVDQTNSAGVQFPFWLTTGETLAINASTYEISVVEFTVNGTSLEFSRVLQVSTQQTVGSGKVWKVESVAKQLNPSSYNNVVFTTSGTYTWKVPTCATYICIEIWGGGGGGGGAASSNDIGSGGGGGGYGQQCFTVTPGTSYTVTVGAGGTTGGSSGSGGNGGTSSVGALISATGGNGGGAGGSGTNGTGGTSGGTNNVSGQNGTGPGTGSCSTNPDAGGAGGNGGAGGAGGACSANGSAGTAPGGGGGGGAYNGSPFSGGAGAAGKVSITW